MNPTSKTQEAKNLYLAGDVKGALKIASTFKIGITREEAKALKSGYEAIVHPAFYLQLGKDLNQMTAKAKEVFELRIVK